MTIDKRVVDQLFKLSNKDKYFNTYIKLIARAKAQPVERSDYMEKHHIIPKSITGVDRSLINDTQNIVKLTPREHFIAHLLLTKVFSDKLNLKKMNWAFYQLRLSNRHQKRYINSRLYDIIKKQPRKFVVLYKEERKIYIDKEDTQRVEELLSQGATYTMPDSYKPGRVGNMKGKSHSPHTKLKMSNSARQSETHGNGLKSLTVEQIKARGIASGRTRKLNRQANPNAYSESIQRGIEKRRKLLESGKLSFKGENNPRYGAKLTEETKQIISIKRQRLKNNGYTHKELFNLFIKPLLDQNIPIKHICKQLPVKKTPYDLRQIILKCSAPE